MTVTLSSEFGFQKPTSDTLVVAFTSVPVSLTSQLEIGRDVTLAVLLHAPDEGFEKLISKVVVPLGR